MMKKISALTLALSILGLIPVEYAPLISPSCAVAETFNMKTGAWEVTYTSVRTGMLLPPEMLERLPPERRAKMEEAMKARSGQPMTRVHKGCITQRDLDQNRFIKAEDDENTDCVVKVLSKSTTKLVMERTCPAPREANFKISIDVKTPESVVGLIDGSIGTGKIHTDVKAHWLGASCEGIKDRE